jgi:hypothetical protein
MDSNSSFASQIRCLTGDSAQRKACRAACTVNTCPLMLSYWSYRPSIPINAAFIAIFVIFTLIGLVIGVWTRRFKKYTAVMAIGNLMEVIGYVARIYAYTYPFSDVSDCPRYHLLLYNIVLTNALAFIHHPANMPYTRSGILRCRHLLLSRQNRADIWRAKLSRTASINS